MRDHTTIVALATLLTFAGAARSEPTDAQRAIAESLFQDAKGLMKDGKYADACPKLEESMRIDPAGGTAINLADCFEHLHKWASAYAMFQKARVMAVNASRLDRVQIANDHLAVVAEHVSRVVVAVPPDARLPQLSVSLDDVDLGPGSWGAPIMVDPGKHTLTAKAPTRKTWTQVLDIGDDAEQTTVTVPILDGESTGGASLPAGESRFGAQRTVALVVGGVGVASLAVGTYFWAHMQSLRSESDDLAAHGDAAAFDKTSDARTAQTWARVTLAAGMVGLGVGAALFFTAPREDAIATSTGYVRVTPSIGPTSWGVGVQGAF